LFSSFIFIVNELHFKFSSSVNAVAHDPLVYFEFATDIAFLQSTLCAMYANFFLERRNDL